MRTAKHGQAMWALENYFLCTRMSQNLSISPNDCKQGKFFKNIVGPKNPLEMVLINCKTLVHEAGVLFFVLKKADIIKPSKIPKNYENQKT